ncbi:MAG: hypothetical protein HY763_02240, partial [Planctomycetes bacterium]|nr:hypothetical protein [Planctomycetota bacterium]
MLPRTLFATSPFVWATVVLVGCCAEALGQQFDLRPRSSTGSYAIIGTDEIRIPAGGVEVTLEIVAHGWSLVPGGPTLYAFQATINGTQGYLGSNAAPPNPGVNLSPKGGVNFNDGTGAFQTLRICSLSNRDCAAPHPPCGPGEGGCMPNPRFVLTPCNPLAAVATVTLNFEYGAASQSTSCGGVVDPGPVGADSFGYCGTLVLLVPGNAKGTYTVDFVQDINKTFMYPDCDLVPCPVMTVPAKITIETGSCCSSIGQVFPSICEDNLTQAECNARPGGRYFRKGVTCAEEQCCGCQNNAACGDPIGFLVDNRCTDNICNDDCQCLNPPLYNVQTHCCNPAVGPFGGLTWLDDGDPCTLDVCDPATGTVSHTPTTGNACDDTFDCTVNDTCDNGTCTGTDVNTIQCVDDSDCPLGTCGTAVGGFCECSENTSLCLEIQGKACSVSGLPCQSDADCGSSGGTCVRLYDDPNCFDGGETMTVAIHIGAGSQQVTGGQFLINYDPACLDFVSIGPCAGDTIFTNVIQTDVDEVAGEIFYAVTNDPATAANESTPGPYNMGCITYTKTADCDACNVCFGGYNPKWTILTNDSGNRVPQDNCGCSKDVRKAGDITLNTPPGASVNADCGKTYANVTWATPSASDTCEGPLAVACAAQSVQGFPVAGLINNGGNYAQGKTFFTCTA